MPTDTKKDTHAKDIQNVMCFEDGASKAWVEQWEQWDWKIKVVWQTEMQTGWNECLKYDEIRCFEMC